jgi:hypothetical protein
MTVEVITQATYDLQATVGCPGKYVMTTVPNTILFVINEKVKDSADVMVVPWVLTKPGHIKVHGPIKRPKNKIACIIYMDKHYMYGVIPGRRRW